MSAKGMTMEQAPIAAGPLEASVRGLFAGPDLTPVARMYRQGRYRRASVLPGPGEGLVKQSDAATWRQIAELRWKMIEDLTRERDDLAEKVLAAQKGTT